MQWQIRRPEEWTFGSPDAALDKEKKKGFQKVSASTSLNLVLNKFYG